MNFYLKKSWCHSADFRPHCYGHSLCSAALDVAEPIVLGVAADY